MQRQTKYMDGVGKGKRGLEGDEDQPPERKRPALASVILEALKVDSLQKLCSSLEPILRRVVSEEVERALAKLAPATLTGSSSPKRIEGPHGRSLQLRFKSKLSLPLFTGGRVEGEQGATIHVVLIDGNTGQVITTGEESSTKLDVIVLEGDFNNEDNEDWTQEEFETHVVKEREGKRPLLTGDLQVTLKEGVGTVGELTFTDNSSWIRSRKFRLGLRVSSGFCEGIRIREAKTEAFTVKDHRGELYKKHYPPALNDEVWRLQKIGKDGAFRKKLNNAGIFTVEDFLRLLVRDQKKLRSILGGGMSNKMWEALVDHAKTCILNGKLYVYYTDDSGNGVVFNDIYELNGLITGDQYMPADSLSDSQKVYVDTLVKKAYDNWNQVVEYDGKSLVNSNQSRRSTRLQMGTVDYPNTLGNQKQLPRLPASVPSEHLHPSLQVGGYNDNLTTRYTSNSLPMTSNLRDQIDSNSFAPQEQLVGSSHQSEMRNNNVAGLALGPPQSSALGFGSVQSSNLNPFDDWPHTRDTGAEEFLTEEEIRLKSHAMLENEDMQHLLHLFSMDGHASMNMHTDEYVFQSFVDSPTQSFDEDRSRSGKAVVSWLKIKAAMRWGFFIRKKAAERRAQIVELEEEESQ